MVIFHVVLHIGDVADFGATVLTLLFVVALVIICHLVALAQFPQDRPHGYNVPWVPLVPAMGIFVNLYLIMKLGYLTLVRFIIWMTIGNWLIKSLIIGHYN